MRVCSVALFSLLAHYDCVASSAESTLATTPNDPTSFRHSDSNLQAVSPRRLLRVQAARDEIEEARALPFESVVSKVIGSKRNADVVKDPFKEMHAEIKSMRESQRRQHLIKALTEPKTWKDLQKFLKFQDKSLIESYKELYGGKVILQALSQAKASTIGSTQKEMRQLYNKQLQTLLKGGKQPDNVLSLLDLENAGFVDLAARLTILNDFLKLFNKKNAVQVELIQIVKNGFKDQKKLATSLAVVKKMTWVEDNQVATLHTQLLQSWIKGGETPASVIDILDVGKINRYNEKGPSLSPVPKIPLINEENFTVPQLATLDEFIELYNLKHPKEKRTLFGELENRFGPEKLNEVIEDLQQHVPKSGVTKKLVEANVRDA